MPGWRLVVCNQNHDQVGNRARGDRFTETLDDDQLALAALLTLAGPFTPMLFMGEEWAASSPFPFFTCHPEPELGRAVSEGRVREFERMAWDVSTIPDPQDPGDLPLRQARLVRARVRPARDDPGGLPDAGRAAAAAARAHRPRHAPHALRGRGRPRS